MKKRLLILLFLLIPLTACSKKMNMENEDSKVGVIALVVDSNLEKVEEKKDLQKPMNPEIGEIAYVRDIYGEFAYVVLLRPMEPQGEDSVGYMPLNNLKFDYTSEEIKEKSIYCHIIKNDTPIYDAPNGNQIGSMYSEYTMIEKREKDWVLVSQKSGAESGWINEKNIDYDFSKFVKEVENKKYEFEKPL